MLGSQRSSTMHRAKHALIIVAVLAVSHCQAPTSPSTLVGDWDGRIVPFHFAHLTMRFTQTASGVAGVACYQDPEGSSDDVGILFKNVPVSISYPSISVQGVAGGVTFSFSGTVTDNVTITGQYRYGNGPVSPMSLTPGSYCQ